MKLQPGISLAHNIYLVMGLLYNNDFGNDAVSNDALHFAYQIAFIIYGCLYLSMNSVPRLFSGCKAFIRVIRAWLDSRKK